MLALIYKQMMISCLNVKKSLLKGSKFSSKNYTDLYKNYSELYNFRYQFGDRFQAFSSIFKHFQAC